MSTCPTCGQPVSVIRSTHITDRELDVLSAWWALRSVKQAAILLGMGEQRAKNLLWVARNRSGTSSNGELAALHLERLRSLNDLLTSHNKSARVAA